MKPRIKKYKSGWVCFNFWICEYGATIEEAFQNWKDPFKNSYNSKKNGKVPR